MSTPQQNNDLALMAEVFTKIPAAILIIDDHGIITHANDSALKLMGSDHLTGEHWVEVISQVFRPRNDDGHQISTRDGRRLQVATIPLAHGQLVQMTDLTETRLLQEKLSHMERLSSLGRMAASLAHQIRTPLSAALLYASNLANDDLAPEMRQRFQQKLMSRLEALEAQISDILMFARSNEQTVSEMDATELIAPVVNNVTALLERSQAHLLTVYDPAVKLPILGNPVALNSALCNLIANAVEAGAKQIAFKVDREGDRVVFSVANDGPTIPEELKTKIFEPFFTSKSSGTGLGLAVVSAVTKVHQGLLTLTAWPEPFTTVFTISIPRYQPQSTATPAPVNAAVNAVVQAQNKQLLATAALGTLSSVNSSGATTVSETPAASPAPRLEPEQEPQSMPVPQSMPEPQSLPVSQSMSEPTSQHAQEPEPPQAATVDSPSAVPNKAATAESRAESTYNTGTEADAVKLGRSASDPAAKLSLEPAPRPSQEVAPQSLNAYLASSQDGAAEESPEATTMVPASASPDAFSATDASVADVDSVAATSANAALSAANAISANDTVPVTASVSSSASARPEASTEELTLEHFLAATQEQRAQAAAVAEAAEASAAASAAAATAAVAAAPSAPFAPDISAQLAPHTPQTTADSVSDLTFVPQSMRNLPPTAAQVSKQEALSANQATLQAFAHYAQSHQLGSAAVGETAVTSEQEQELLSSMRLSRDAHMAGDARMAGDTRMPGKQQGSGAKDKVSPHHRAVRKAHAKNQSPAQAYETVPSEQFGFREVDIEIKPPKVSTRGRGKAHGPQRS